MPKIQLDASAYVEDAYGLGSSILENWYVEEIGKPSSWNYRFIPTPGLVAFSAGGAKGRGVGQSDAIASGEILAVRDTGVVRVASNGTVTAITGTIVDDNKPATFAFSQVQAVLNSGGSVYTVTGSAITNFTSNLTSAGAAGDIIDIAVIENRHLYAEDNSARVFYSDPGAAATIGGFFTAERDPDQALALLSVGSNVLVFGTKKTEFWTPTGSDTKPFIQRQGFVLEYGIVGSKARAQIGGVGYWVAHDNTVRRWAGVGAERISGHWMERQIASLTAANKALIRVTTHNWIGHQFVRVYLPGKGSYFYDALTGAWHRRKDLGAEVVDWGFDYFVEAFGNTYVQKLSDGSLCRLDSRVFLENSQIVRRVASLMIDVPEPLRIGPLIVEGQPGIGLPDTTGDGFDPQCMLRVSYDGRTFGDEIIRPIGNLGEWRYRTVITPIGTLKPPRAIIELAYSDPVGWTVQGFTYNERVA